MILKFYCSCGESKAILSEEKLNTTPCKCGKEMQRAYGGLTSNKTETIDPGWQVKAVQYDAERNAMHREEGDRILERLKGNQ